MESEKYFDIALSSKLIIATTTITVITFVSLFWKTYFSAKIPKYPFPLESQSVEVEPGVRGSKLAKNGNMLEYLYDDVKTTHEAFLRGMRVSKNGPFLGTREKTSTVYKWISFKEAYEQAHKLGSALVAKGLNPNDSTFVGIYSQNCPEWTIAAQACSMFSMVTVPLYDTLGVEACQYIINQTQMEFVICYNWSKAQFLIDEASSAPTMKKIIVMKADDLSGLKKKDDSIISIKEIAEKAGVEILTYQDALIYGEKNLRDIVPPKPESIFTISYTSGTTGNPKGVVLTHRAIIANASGIITHLSDIIEIGPEDSCLSYLPLAHMFERLNQITIMIMGTKIGFSCGDIRYLMDDLAALKPTIFPVVPRLLNRVYDQLKKMVATNIFTKVIFELAISRKIGLLKKGIISRNTIWDKIQFEKIQTMLGGRVRFCITGSAPSSKSVIDFARAAFGCYVFEGYGQTEVTAAATITAINEYETGIVGPPLANCHIKLVDIPEMDYYAKNNKGEICIKSIGNMSCYFKEPEKTKETLDEDGYVHTGDVGQWLNNGSLKVIDRKKNIFKLAQGEYLAPEKIEDIYSRSLFVAQVFVDGDSLQVYPLGIVVPDSSYIRKYAKTELGIDNTFEELCKNPDIKKAILNDLTKKGKEGNLKGFEMVKDIYLHSELFSMENGFLTPTFKSKRPALRTRFQDTFKEMYSTLNSKR